MSWRLHAWDRAARSAASAPGNRAPLTGGIRRRQQAWPVGRQFGAGVVEQRAQRPVLGRGRQPVEHQVAETDLPAGAQHPALREQPRACPPRAYGYRRRPPGRSPRRSRRRAAACPACPRGGRPPVRQARPRRSVHGPGGPVRRRCSARRSAGRSGRRCAGPARRCRTRRTVTAVGSIRNTLAGSVTISTARPAASSRKIPAHSQVAPGKKRCRPG